MQVQRSNASLRPSTPEARPGGGGLPTLPPSLRFAKRKPLQRDVTVALTTGENVDTRLMRRTVRGPYWRGTDCGRAHHLPCATDDRDSWLPSTLVAGGRRRFLAHTSQQEPILTEHDDNFQVEVVLMADFIALSKAIG
jgi:hypothetical protein